MERGGSIGGGVVEKETGSRRRRCRWDVVDIFFLVGIAGTAFARSGKYIGLPRFARNTRR